MKIYKTVLKVKIIKKLVFTILFSLLSSVSGLTQEHLEHSIWNELLSKHVSDDGRVNYKGFIADSSRLNRYLDSLSAHHPEERWNKNDRLAYWINAYNAFTVKLIVDNYPVESIKDLGGSLYKINTTWDIKFIHIGDETYDLNNIEHGIIRKEFDEPRIHFAVNCASVSCPKLRNEAYVGGKLDTQLDDQTHSFINNPEKNKIRKKKIELSKIFKWFGRDFESGGKSVIQFINQYSEIKISKKNKINHLNYDWSLNE